MPLELDCRDELEYRLVSALKEFDGNPHLLAWLENNVNRFRGNEKYPDEMYAFAETFGNIPYVFRLTGIPAKSITSIYKAQQSYELAELFGSCGNDYRGFVKKALEFGSSLKEEGICKKILFEHVCNV